MLALTFIQLSKPRTLGLLVFVALASALSAPGSVQAWRLAALALSGAMACAGAAWLNNYLDRDIDSVMERTRRRPLPQGLVNPRMVLAGGLALLAGSLPLAATLGPLVALWVALGAVIYVGVYTAWLKRRSALNIVLGGGAGSCAALAGWYATGQQGLLTPALLALLLFLWTPAHFWSFAIAHQTSYAQGRVPMLPLVVGVKQAASRALLTSLMLTPVALGLLSSERLGLAFAVTAVALGAAFALTSFRQWREPSVKNAWLNYKFSGLYLLGLMAALIADRVI